MGVGAYTLHFPILGCDRILRCFGLPSPHFCGRLHNAAVFICCHEFASQGRVRITGVVCSLDTLIGKQMGRMNRGRTWLEAARLRQWPHIMVLNAAMHISNVSGFQEVISTIRRQYVSQSVPRASDYLTSFGLHPWVHPAPRAFSQCVHAIFLAIGLLK